MEHGQERNPLKYAPGIRIKYSISVLMYPCITLEYCLLTLLCAYTVPGNKIHLYYIQLQA
jgi:hypothetical protein